MLDLVIIGGSAAGTAAGIYAARRRLDFKMITKEFGGEVATSGEIGNWPGVNQTDGLKLAGQFKEHLEYYGVKPQEGVEVKSISKENGSFSVWVKENGRSGVYRAKTVIIATGVHPRELKVPGEKKFRGKGLSYCTVCDGVLFSGKITATIGGGNSALESALMLSTLSPKIYLINKNPKFKGDQILMEKVKAQKNVEIIFNALTSEIIGGDFVKGLKYKDAEGREHKLEAEGIFVHIGMEPNSQIISSEVKKNEFGEIIVDKNCQTNIPGLFAAGDVTDVPFKQIVIAAGQGCVAALSAVSYLNKLK